MPKFQKLDKSSMDWFQSLSEETSPDGKTIITIKAMVIPCLGVVLQTKTKMYNGKDNFAISESTTFIPDANIKDEKGVKKLIKERTWR